MGLNGSMNTAASKYIQKINARVEVPFGPLETNIVKTAQENAPNRKYILPEDNSNAQSLTQIFKMINPPVKPKANPINSKLESLF